MVLGGNLNLRTLIVDDEPEICSLLEDILNEKMTVTATASPEKALQLLDKEKFDIVITDMRMPKVSGDKIARKVKELSHKTTLIIISGHLGQSVPNSLIGCEPYLLIEKPFKSIQSFSEQVLEFYNKMQKTKAS